MTLTLQSLDKKNAKFRMSVRIENNKYEDLTPSMLQVYYETAHQTYFSNPIILSLIERTVDTVP